MEQEYLRVGVISSTHGLRGEVKVFPTTDDVTRFKELKDVKLDTGKELLSMEITSTRFFKQMAIVKFKGYDSINDIEKYKGKDILIPREKAVELLPGEYFIYDLIGCQAVTDDNRNLGKVTEVLTTRANSVYVIKQEDGKEILLPAIEDCILNVDIEKKEILVHMLKGLE